ncbi:hypothetical protein [Rubrobacter radiotolerans]|uniref:Uncharacterized protein n=1 Tax=Rubrobacter radiotolerans TaxID=42256 RepID=A0AB35SZW0_RUBRA|nr:hypothetical protein [Rubrobacter radiotolerans]MDX5893035.1 hypothetical protein [Rubrobacter radiotolerans]
MPKFYNNLFPKSGCEARLQATGDRLRRAGERPGRAPIIRE